MTNNRPIKKLGELIDIQNGFAFDASLFSNTEGFPLIRIRDIKNSFTETKYKGVYKEDFIVRKGDILVGMDGEFKCYVWNGEDALLNQRVCRLIKNNGNIDMDFLLYGINSFLKDIEDTTAFVTVKHISSKQIKEIDFPFPPLATQQLIVAKLDETFAQIDEAIATTQANIDKTDELTKSVLDKVFEEGEWEKVRLNDIFDVRDGTHDSPKFFDEGYPLVTSKNLLAEGLSLEKVNLIKQEDYDNINKRSKVDKGDLLFAMIGTIGNPTIVYVEPNFAIKNVALFKQRDGKGKMEYLRYFLLSETTIKKMVNESKGATQKFVGLNYLRNFEIPLPPLAKQQEIVSYLDDVFAQSSQLKEQYQKKLVELKELKASVLQSAFEGKLV